MINKVLGLDLGAASIGWALISEESNENDTLTRKIIDMGSRIIPYEGTEGQDFSKGTGESKNSVRTGYRSARRRYDRYQLRRSYLIKTLKENNLMPSEALIGLSKMQLWEIRAKAATEKITNEELGRVFLWLNQKRGYKSSRSDANLDKKDTQYVADVKSRHQIIKDLDFTIGQYFFDNLKNNEFFRVKENVFPREAYVEEYNTICLTQSKFNPSLNQSLISKIRDEIIYYQRPLKSQKGLVSICEFEGFWAQKDGKKIFAGPKVVHRSNPVFQLSKIWESINNLRIRTKNGDELYLTLDIKNKIFNHLDNNDRLSVKDLCKIIDKKEDEIYVDRKLYKTGIQGNVIKTQIKKCIDNINDFDTLTEFKVKIIEDPKKEAFIFDKKSGEIIEGSICTSKTVDRSIEFEPYYQLWHTIYSINDIDECANTLIKNFNISEEVAQKLAKIDFAKFSYGNKSVKCLRKILPYLIDGYDYASSMMCAGYNHSGSLTKDENLSRELEDLLAPLQKNSIRQPVVEKILNQMINLVNELIRVYGKPNEIRVELARELKQSREERNDTERFVNQRNKENESIAKELAEYGLRATRNNIVKWRLYKEIDNEEKKMNAICIYCGKQISFSEAIKGNDVDIEHIIPKSKLFDDSQGNKTLAHRHCNSTKGNMTAYDFMKGKPEVDFIAYVERVNLLFEKGLVSKGKRDKLLMSESKIPDDFIDRQLRESQYISKKAKDILGAICHNVYCTSGTITSELRRLWGWEDVTMRLQFEKYKDAGLTDIVTWESNHGKDIHEKEVIKDWTKRNDHRHHAVDALTIACTKQGYIQKFNTLNSQKTIKEIEKDIYGLVFKEKLSTLEKFIVSKKPFSEFEVEEAVSKILISFKSGKKVASVGKRKIGRRGNKRVVQEGILIPRGSLSEESVYGKIKIIENQKIKYLFENPELIINKRIKSLVIERLDEFNNNVKKALDSLKKKPIKYNNDTELQCANCFREEFVIKYAVDINFNKVDKVIDKKIKEILTSRLNKFDNKPKEAFKDVKTADGIVLKWYEDEKLSHPIYSVRCFTGLSAVVPIKINDKGDNIGFVKPGNNHHVAIYQNKDGELFEQICTFWHAVERKKYGIPVVINDSNKVWDYIQKTFSVTLPEAFLVQLPAPGSVLKLSMQQNEMFVLGLPYEDFQYAIENEDYKTISNHLYRVQKIASSYYVLRHHLETQLDDSINALDIKKYYRIRSITSLQNTFPQKIKINILGKIKID